MKRTTTLNLVALFLLGLCALLVGCAGGGGEEATDSLAEAKASTAPVKKAIAWLNPRSGSEMGGSAIFIRDPDGRISLQISLQQAPPGIHAVHIHEFGDCSADDGSSAGGHWNPTGEDHGQWGEAPHHLGDIGNVEVGEDGEGTFELVTDKWTMGGGADNDILIYTALVTTLCGLFIAIPSAVLAHYFEGRITSLFHQIDELLFNLLPQVERYEGRVRFNRQMGEEDGERGKTPSTGQQPPVAASVVAPTPK